MASLTEPVGWQDPREFMLPPLLNPLKETLETGLSALAWVAAGLLTGKGYQLTPG